MRISTGCVKVVPLGSQRNTFESTTKPAGAALESSTEIVTFVDAATAPFGKVTVAPATWMTPPSGPMGWVTASPLADVVDELHETVARVSTATVSKVRIVMVGRYPSITASSAAA